MLSGSIAARRGVLKEQLEACGKRKAALNSTCFAPPQAAASSLTSAADAWARQIPSAERKAPPLWEPTSPVVPALRTTWEEELQRWVEKRVWVQLGPSPAPPLAIGARATAGRLSQPSPADSALCAPR